MKLSIIIVNYNTPELVYACLESIQRNLTELSYEVLLIDNASTLPLEPNLLPKEAQYLPQSTNLGFGGANNLGAGKAQGEYLWFLNSDTLLPDQSSMLLPQFMDSHPEFAICSPLLYLDSTLLTLQPDFYASFQNLTTLLFRKTRPILDLTKQYQQVDLVVGAALFIRAKRFIEIGGFDSNLFMYMEDDDLCLRAGKVAIITGSRVIHFQGQSITKQQERKKLYYQSQSYFWRKHYGQPKTWLMQALRAPYVLFKR